VEKAVRALEKAATDRRRDRDGGRQTAVVGTMEMEEGGRPRSGAVEMLVTALQNGSVECWKPSGERKRLSVGEDTTV
jgi:hypothetical protein